MALLTSRNLETITLILSEHFFLQWFSIRTALMQWKVLLVDGRDSWYTGSGTGKRHRITEPCGKGENQCGQRS
jgi:hypothetical protein